MKNVSDIKITLISLGCSKNLVDCECMSRMLRDYGYSIIDDVSDSDVAVINTCGFIESAKSEAIDTILRCADYKTQGGRLKYIIVTGCLSQRYPEDILKEMPEVDAILGTSHYQDICRVVTELFAQDNSGDCTQAKISYVSDPGGLKHLLTDRDISTGSYAWLKIGEGCLHRCAFCAIPLIRGSFVSRPFEDIISEAEIIASKGIKELILAAQDTTNYGVDLYHERRLPQLLRALSGIEGIRVIRVMYGYMDGIDDSLISEIATNPKVASYLDIPIQHGCNKILKAMYRKDTVELITERLEKIRKAIPDIIVRTTVMVGFPGETQEDFEELKSNLIKWRFDRLGCFIFSPEEGTRAFDMPNQVDADIKQQRYDEIYELSRKISEDSVKSRLGTEIYVIIDSVADDGIFYIGRSYGESPEVDPSVYVISQDGELNIGDMVKVRIVDCSDEYDMTGVTI
ncbi:MAG: 30S ribosomal protein S12 methylthiotransferase RimO [Saccharofermentans sp.]|jgi:ribosomal protein S12 methylthiotransferase|nr:30S ribosomal protein S12 methylthiotransferase RimO [Mageeibacillus sp.]MCI1263466.1 30S ribosomal protein S12 methylthiotransferase RimO [Saccharofermentans sp.]MCI1274904.1 30S ribosomal protein S12 methylthiotransferase RimO [Saccharofermentans sp.]MCI2044001.1 30S ribosomal protein S12 methylthiotransferase RimO [Mageeibacillus sp.]